MANPILSRTKQLTSTNPMTTQGVIQKTALLLGLSSVSGFGLFFYALAANVSSGALMPIFVVAMLATMGLGLAAAFSPHLAKTLAVPYALLEGVLLGSVSAIAYRYYPSVPLTALSATFVTAAVMLGLYATGVVKVTQKMRSIVLSAVIAIMIVYAVQWLLRLVFGSSLPLLFDGGMLAIGFSLFVIVIAAFTLLIDFDNVDKGVFYGADKQFEWLHGMAILSTLVWMYVEFLRLLGYLQD